MIEILDWLSRQLSGEPMAVGLVVMLFAMAGGIVVLGRYVPGMAVVLAIAAAAGAAGQGLMTVFVATALGAVAGDLVSYAIGRRAGAGLAEWGWLGNREAPFAVAEQALEPRPLMGIAFARWRPSARAMVPAYAGIERVAVVPFVIVSILSGAAFAAVAVFGVGGAAAILAEIGGRLSVAVIAALIVLALALWLGRFAASITFSYVVEARQAAHRWADAREGRVARFLAWTLNPEDVTGLLVLLWTAVLFIALFLFAELAGDVWQADDIVDADLALNRFVQSFRSPALDTVMIVITMLGDWMVLTTVAAAVTGWLLFKRSFWVAGAFAGALLATPAFVALVKGLLGRARPLTDLYSGVDNFSFPSGHATNSMVLFGLVAVLISGGFRGRWRAVVGAAIAILPLAIAGSRIYLQAHWPSDVTAGLAFALAVTAAFAIALRWLPSAPVHPRGLALVAVTALVLAGGANIALNFDKSVVKYAPHDLAVPLSEAEWQADPWARVGQGRVGFEGELETPFVVQWLGDTALLDEALVADGWERAGAWQPVGRAGARLVPRMHLGREPDAIWIRADPEGGSLVFQLWRSRYKVDEQPLFVATVARLVDLLGVVAIVDDDRLPPRPSIERLQRAIADAAGSDPARRYVLARELEPDPD